MTNLCDPVTLEIIRGAIAPPRPKWRRCSNAPRSAFIREKKDFYTALFDADGVMVVGSNVPIFGDITAPVFPDFPARHDAPGDLYWYNDCYASRGAVSHSNDQVFLAPVFHHGNAPPSSWAGRISPTSAACAPARSAPTPPTSSRRASSSRRPA